MPEPVVAATARHRPATSNRAQCRLLVPCALCLLCGQSLSTHAQPVEMMSTPIASISIFGRSTQGPSTFGRKASTCTVIAATQNTIAAKMLDICDCCVEVVIRNHNRNQKNNHTIVSWPPNICDCCAESIGESAVRSYMRQKKEPNVPKRKTNRSMTKTAIVKHVASTHDVAE